MGQLILVGKRFLYEYTYLTKTDRILSMEIQTDEDKLFVASVYTPNASAERKLFFINLEKYVNDNKTERKIKCGDFNCVADKHNQIMKNVSTPS